LRYVKDIIPQRKSKGNGNASATPLPYGLVFEKISDSKNHFRANFAMSGYQF
jgi:hypothetical protein